MRDKTNQEFLAAWDKNPKLFSWTATVESIVEKLSRCRQTLGQIRPGCTLPDGEKRNVELASYLADATLEPGGMRTNWARAQKDVPELLPDYEASVGPVIKSLESL